MRIVGKIVDDPNENKTAVKKLAHWFERQKRVLPWRENPEIYRVWISEVMLQQTQVATVVPYFERFISRFPNVEALALAPQDEVMKYWAGLGYYSRARNLHHAAQRIHVQGSFPCSVEAWLELPGIGRYTAGAIVSIALNQPVPILDGNVERVLSRVMRWGRDKKEALWGVSEDWVIEGAHQKIEPRVLNQALMELGATICTPRSPACLLCPLQEICQACNQGDQQNFPQAKKKKEWLDVNESTHLLFDRDGKVFLEKRVAGEWRAGLWDLPRVLPVPERAVEEVGEVKTSHIVTCHKISRTTRVLLFKGKALGAMADGSWFHYSDLMKDRDRAPVAVGSALKKTLKEAGHLLGQGK